MKLRAAAAIPGLWWFGSVLLALGLQAACVASTGTNSLTVPGVSKPEFRLTFIPLNWSGSTDSFQQEAQRQAAYFIHESGLEVYFVPRVVILDAGVNFFAPDNNAVVKEVVTFGKLHAPADRYIGLTDSALFEQGIPDLAGWTGRPGGQGVLIESENHSERLLAHELGHTFGLCDEYTFLDWQLQDRTYPEGCPNPYPRDCPKLATQKIICVGQPTEDGRFSLMGPAGLDGEYGYNQTSAQHLQQAFRRVNQEKRLPAKAQPYVGW